jgi:hypothetical protein
VSHWPPAPAEIPGGVLPLSPAQCAALTLCKAFADMCSHSCPLVLSGQKPGHQPPSLSAKAPHTHCSWLPPAPKPGSAPSRHPVLCLTPSSSRQMGARSTDLSPRPTAGARWEGDERTGELCELDCVSSKNTCWGLTQDLITRLDLEIKSLQVIN